MSNFTTDTVAKALRTPVTMDWMNHRACIGVPPAVFFPGVGGTARTAKAICGSCPVAAECLSYALENREPAGVWGGMSPRERRRLQKPPRPRSVARCGTSAGYRAHRRRNEDACQPCLDANAAATRERKQAAA